MFAIFAIRTAWFVLTRFQRHVQCVRQTQPYTKAILCALQHLLLEQITLIAKQITNARPPAKDICIFGYPKVKPLLLNIPLRQQVLLT